MTPQETRRKNLVDKMAMIQHDIWAHWMKYQFSRCEDDDLGMVIQWDDVKRWQRQMNTPYTELSEAEKESDRKVVEDFIISTLEDLLGW